MVVSCKTIPVCSTTSLPHFCTCPVIQGTLGRISQGTLCFLIQEFEKSEEHFSFFLCILCLGNERAERPALVSIPPHSNHKNHFAALQSGPLFFKINIDIDEVFEVHKKLMILLDWYCTSGRTNRGSSAIRLQYAPHRL